MNKRHWISCFLVMIFSQSAFPAGEKEKETGVRPMRSRSARPFPTEGEKSGAEAQRKKRRLSRTLSVASTDIDPFPSKQEPVSEMVFNEVCKMEGVRTSQPLVSRAQEESACNLPYGYSPGDAHTVAANGDFVCVSRFPPSGTDGRVWISEGGKEALPHFISRADHRTTPSPHPRRATPQPSSFTGKDTKLPQHESVFDLK